ncbi:MAG: substrate-binding domain-containing protein [Bacillota bacterium]|nr:substrate-binding domain-containing protein [Bacillota bacterium]
MIAGRRLLWVFVVAVTMILLNVGITGFAAEKNVKVVHVALGNYGDHWVQLVNGAKSMAQDLGRVDLVTLEAQLSVEKQVQLLENATTMKPDVIFVDHGAGEALTPGIERAMKAGIKVVIFDVLTTAEVICDISQDDYMLAYLSLNRMAQDLGGKGNIVVIARAGSAPMERRKRILPLILDRYKGLKVVAEFSPEIGKIIPSTIANMESVLLAHPKPDSIQAVWAPYDQYAVGACQAIKPSGRDISVYSIDVSPHDLELMRAPGSVWRATAACDPTEIGRVAIRVAYLAATGQKVPQYIQIPAVLITQEDARALAPGQYLTKEIVPLWGDTGIAWTSELRAMVGKKK